MAQGGSEYIDSVPTGELDDAIQQRRMDAGSDALLDAELGEIQSWRGTHKNRPEASRENLTGLALSGGGIRSATFCLGVIQSLVKDDLFKRFDYLSTVSGGGYIGSSITWLTSEAARQAAHEDGKTVDFGCVSNNFPYGSADPTQPDSKDIPQHQAMLKYLRQHGNYLVPGNGISIKSGIAVVLRGIIVNLLVWLPILSAIFFGLFWMGHSPGNWFNQLADPIISNTPWVGVWSDFTSFSFFASAMAETFPKNSAAKSDFLKQVYVFRQTFQLFFVFAGLFVVYAAVYSFATWFNPKAGNSRYALRRGVETASGAIIWTLLILIVVGTIPMVWVWVESTGGITAALAGAVTGAWGYLKSGNKGAKGSGIPIGIIAPVGAILLLFGVVLISFSIANYVFTQIIASISDPNFRADDILAVVKAGVISVVAILVGMACWSEERRGVPLTVFFLLGPALFTCGAVLYDFMSYLSQGALNTTLQDPKFKLLMYFYLAILLAVALGFIVNLNYMTVHRYYRDRLMETFLPNIKRALANITGRAGAADQAHIPNLWRYSRPEESVIQSVARRFTHLFGSEDPPPRVTGSPRSPYHIVNTNVMLVNSKKVRRYRMRGGDNFIFSPLYSGSNATGWRLTKDYLGGSLTLATAMAISGAAANPNTGVGGVGLTRNPAVSVLMGLLDIRLGYWVRRPRKVHSIRSRPNHFHPGFWEFINKGLKENSQFLQLSDGGHFENLGLYELIRRRLKLIVCCDAGADSNTSFSDFQVTLRRIKADFGAEIKFDGNNKPRTLVPHRDAGYPAGAKMADRGHIVGTITYSDGNTGTLILIKTTLVPDLRLQVLGYKSANPTFPDQTTADQFFDEEQFEAYRELGYVIGSRMIEDAKLEQKLKSAESWSGTIS